ncbi:MAG: hypothetical protein ACLQVI_28770 [Polyangiaceae bacterium]|jgi:hypothetical protein
MRPGGALTLAALVGLSVLGVVGALGACDGNPVHDNEVAALGPESPEVPQGPFHRPGQPCLVCHGGEGPASLQFAVAGTIYQAQTGTLVPQNGAVVDFVDTNDVPASAGTNTVGNFWVLESQWVPTFPVHVVSVTYGTGSDAAQVSMYTHIGQDGSCATCHSDPPGGDLVGHIYVAPGAEPDGGFPGGGP